MNREIREKIDRILDDLPEDELNQVYQTAACIHRKYMFKANILQRGVTISTVFAEGKEIVTAWDNAFASQISDETKEAIYYDQYKWHIFSYGKQDCLQAEMARRAFDSEAKDAIYVMNQSHSVFLYEHAADLVAADFDSGEDMYIFDRHLTWTYVVTHEEMCGPYFYSLK
ncbi:DUF4275 family protein [Paenibacillus chibensis]|uniref:DUF4275 family protein n=2 Tax=Paenibacillus chibensis TaxID=59846 RepID=UPI000FDBF91B|nr:DUF4275 family protein [Paenibacillus chibensis]MEC0368593.1 DUF4275 family protein [Paenibacillus chibensis]